MAVNDANAEGSVVRRVRWRAWIIFALLLIGAGWFGVKGYRVAFAPPGLPGRYVAEFDALLKPYRTAPGPDAWAEMATVIGLKMQLEAEAWPAAPAGSTPGVPAASSAPQVATGSASNWRFDALYIAKGDPNEAPEAAVDAARKGIAVAKRLGIPEVLGRIAPCLRVIRPSPDAHVINFVLPELGQARYLARYCAGRMIEAARTGDHDERVEAFEHALGLGRIVSCNFTIIDRMVGVAVHRLAFDRLRADLIKHPLPEAHLRRALEAIERHPLPSILTSLEGERIGMLDSIEWSHSDLPNDDGHYQPATARTSGLAFMAGGSGDPFDPSTWPTPLANLSGWFLPSKRQTTRKINDLMEGMKRSAASHRMERDAIFNADEWMARLPIRYMLIRYITPSLERMLEGADEHQLLTDATRLMLAIEIHRHQHGAPPESLEQLVPSRMPSVPLDAINGKPYVYRRREPVAPGQPVTAPGYVLYSMAGDGLDNGGTEYPNDAFRALRKHSPGFDFPMVPPAGLSR